LDARRQALHEAQRKFAELAKADFANAALEVAAEEIRIYRDGSFPAIGKNAAESLLKAKAGRMSFESIGSDMSHSADLAYTYGKYSVTRGAGSESGHFFQIWQSDTVGTWKLVLDWQQALPPEKS
jgi:hypothetical protein